MNHKLYSVLNTETNGIINIYTESPKMAVLLAQEYSNSPLIFDIIETKYNYQCGKFICKKEKQL